MTGFYYAASDTTTSLTPMAGAVPVGSISQLVATPAGPATLSFQLRFLDFLGELPIELAVMYNGTVLTTLTGGSTTFAPVTIPIPGALLGPNSRVLEFRTTCFNNGVSTEGCRRYDIDDVSLTTPDPADTTAPETTITKAPAKATVRSKRKRARVPVSFESNEPGAGFECQLDGRGYTPCSSPATLKLKKGSHTFLVRARDAAGNADPSPASATIKVKVKRRR
jgi:hypothetical protein